MKIDYKDTPKKTPISQHVCMVAVLLLMIIGSSNIVELLLAK